jgi:hypothetical protein
MSQILNTEYEMLNTIAESELEEFERGRESRLYERSEAKQSRSSYLPDKNEIATSLRSSQ